MRRMSNNLIFPVILFYFYSQHSAASANGHPDEDPVVKVLRDEFAQAGSPTKEEIVGKLKCQGFFAEKGETRGYDSEFELIYVGNNIFGASDGDFYRLTPDGLRSSYRNSRSFSLKNLRINRQTAEILMEISSSEELDAPGSISNPKSRGYIYSRCQKQRQE